MTEANGLEIGRVYDLEIKGRSFGKCLYLGKRQGDGVVYRNIIAQRVGGFVFGLVFDGYSSIGDRLIIDVKRNAKLSPNQIRYLEERLKKEYL